MIKSTKVLLFVLMALPLASCKSSLPAYQVSQFESKTNVTENYDEDAKLGYTVSKDSENLYVHLNSFDTATQLKILKNGVRLYFDDKGKKAKHTFVHYPVIKNNESVRPDFESLKEDKITFLQNLISGLGDEMHLAKHEDVNYINRELNTQGITVDLDMVDETLNYRLKLPLSFLETQENQLPALGIAIAGIERPSSAQGGGRPMGVSGGRPAGGGGGRPSGVGGGRPSGGGRGRPSGTTAQNGPFEGMGSDIAIWFQLDIQS